MLKYSNLDRKSLWVSIALQLAVAVILLQTLFFKFTGAEESVYIFTQLGMEPWGRIATGVAELIAAVLLIVPATAVVGAVITMGLMAGAIFSHLTQLGIEVMGDGGQLFGLAVIALLASAVVAFLRRFELVQAVRFGLALIGISTRRWNAVS